MGALRSAFVCREGRELVSLRLDGELSELEQARLDSHLRACADCRAYEAEVARATHMLRSAPLESIGRHVALPHRRHLPLRALQVGAAAALVLVATALGTLLGPLRSHETASSIPIVLARVGDDHSDQTAQRALRRQQLTPPARLTTPRRRGGSQPL